MSATTRKGKPYAWTALVKFFKTAAYLQLLRYASVFVARLIQMNHDRCCFTGLYVQPNWEKDLAFMNSF